MPWDISREGWEVRKRSWVGEQKGSKGEVGDSGRGPPWERRGVWSPVFQRGMGVGGQLSRGFEQVESEVPHGRVQQACL